LNDARRHEILYLKFFTLDNFYYYLTPTAFFLNLKRVSEKSIPVDPPPPITQEPQTVPSSALPQNQPQPAPQNTTPSQPTNNSFLTRGKIITAVLLLIILTLFGGGAVALAYNDYKILPLPKSAQKIIDGIILTTPLPKTPRIVLAKTAAGMSELKSTQVETEFSFSTANQNFPLKNGKITIIGPVDFKSQKIPRSQFDISGTIATQGLQLSAAASVRQIDNILYFKITEYPGGSFAGAQGISNQWFYTKNDNLDKPTKDPELIKKIQERINQFIDDSKKWSTLEDSDKAVYKLLIQPPKDELAKFIFDIINIVEPSDQNKVADSLDLEKIQEFTAKIQGLKITLNINKDSGLISESIIDIPIKISIPSSLSQIGEINLAPETPMEFKLTISAKFSNFNQPVIVEIPEGAKDFADYAKDLQKSLPLDLSSPPESAPNEDLEQSLPDINDDNLDTDTNELRSLLEESQIQGVKDSTWNIFLKSF